MSTSPFKRLTVLSLIFILHSLFGPKTLYAMPHETAGIERFPIARQLASTKPRVRVVGELSCTSETANISENSNSCALNIREQQTGKTYRLTGENESAQKLFNNGNKKVAVEGTFSNESTFNVQTTQAL